MLLSNLKGRVDLTAGKTPSNNVYTPQKLGPYKIHGLAIGPDSEIDSIFVRDKDRYANEPLLVSVGHPFSGHLSPDAEWWPAKSGHWRPYTSSSSRGPRFDILCFANGLQPGSYHARAPYCQPLDGTNLAISAFWVAGRRKIRLWAVNPSTTDALLLSLKIFGMAEANRIAGGPEAIGIEWDQVLTFAPGDGATSSTPIEFPLATGSPSAGLDLIEISAATVAGQANTGWRLLVQAED